MTSVGDVVGSVGRRAFFGTMAALVTWLLGLLGAVLLAAERTLSR